MADNNGTQIKLNMTKIIAWTMSTMFTLLLALVIFVSRSYIEKVDSMDNKMTEIVVAIGILQTQGTSTAKEISDIKESVKEVRTDVKELGR